MSAPACCSGLASSTPSQPGPLRRAAAASGGAAGVSSLLRDDDTALAEGASGAPTVRIGAGAGAAAVQAPSDRHSSVETNRARMMQDAVRGAGVASWYHVPLVRAARSQLQALILVPGLALLAPVAACGGTRAGLPVGVSDAVPERSSPARPPPPRPAWPDFEAARAWPAAAPATPARAHFRDGTLVRVHVEPPGLDAYRQLAIESPMPANARVVAWHETHAGQLRGGYLLEKRQGAWSAHEIDAAGALVPGDRIACLRCHEMAPTDHLFGVPQAPAVPAGATVPESISPSPR